MNKGRGLKRQPAGFIFIDTVEETEMNNADYEELKRHASEIIALRRSKAFRRKLLASRFVQEVLKGDAAAKRDFAAFVKSKLGKGNKPSRPLSDFDPTKGEEVKTAEALIDRYAANAAASCRRQIVILSQLQYYTSGGGQRGAQLAKAFAKSGFDVLYLYAADNYYSFDLDFIDYVSLHLPIMYFTEQRLAELLRTDAIAILEHPNKVFLPYMRALKSKGIKTVYEHIDNWETELGEDWYSRDDYLTIINEADVLTASARNLCEMVEEDSGRNAVYIANAVNTELFDPSKHYDVPADMPLGKKTLLYYGHGAGSWLDWDLLYDTAELCPDCSFVAIIIVFDMPFTERKCPDNVHILAEKPQSELPAYLAACDFAVLHFKASEVGRYVSPIKVFEYLAMHKPVLATPLPEIAGYPNVICSEDPKVWAQAIMDPPAPEPYDDFVSSNSWLARCSSILKEVDKD